MGVEGTLSLFDWSSAQPATVATVSLVPKAPLAANESATVASIVVFDVETTGTDRMVDQIIELCVQFGLHEGAPSKTLRFKPDVAMSPGAQAVHGIAMEELADCPRFVDAIADVEALFANANVIVGYNLTFDIDMLAAEFSRVGRTPPDFSAKTIVDPFRLWQQCEPRSLQHAHQRFVGNRFEDAHTAAADVAATGRVLGGMLQAFGLDGQDWQAIANVCDPGRASWVGPTKHLRWEDGVIIIGFGKHSGAVLHTLAQGPDKGFLRWVISKDFPTHVVDIFRAVLEQPEQAFLQWAAQRYGQPAPTALPAFAV
jgi:DNA polymerase III subunit epsilon